MVNLLIAAAILIAIIYGSKFFATASPALLARLVKQGGGLAALAVAGFIGLRGHMEIAIGLGGFGLYLLGWGSSIGWGKYFGNVGSGQRPGGASRVRSAMIEMELDHATGAMEGLVLVGAYEGRQLGALTRPQCEDLYQTCLRDDPDGARLLEPYLDRRFPGWRPAYDTGDDPGSRDGDTRARATGKMSEDEAYEVLGLAKTATREEVVSAHRALMKKLHPDHGGTTSLAARVNEAKEILLRRHT
jgi:hypothetical protein